MSALATLYAPLAEPVHLDEVKSWLRMDTTAEDALIQALIRSARTYAEQFLGRALVNQTLIWASDSFYRLVSLGGLPLGSTLGALGGGGYVSFALPEAAILGLTPFGTPLRLPSPPLLAVDSIQYTDPDGTLQTMASADYQVDKLTEPARLLPAYGKAWPSTRAVLNAVKIQFRAGYVTPFAATGGQAALAAKRHPYAVNDVLRLTNSGGALPAGFAAATDYYVVDATTDAPKLSATQGGVAITPSDAGTGQHFLGIVPDGVLAAIRLMVSQWFDNREAPGQGENPSTLISNAAKMLLWPDRILEA